MERIHIVGDFYDRGDRPDGILDLLMEHPSVDIQWGNHDVLWMGAALGSEVCIAAVIRKVDGYRRLGHSTHSHVVRYCICRDV